MSLAQRLYSWTQYNKARRSHGSLLLKYPDPLTQAELKSHAKHYVNSTSTLRPKQVRPPDSDSDFADTPPSTYEKNLLDIQPKVRTAIKTLAGGQPDDFEQAGPSGVGTPHAPVVNETPNRPLEEPGAAMQGAKRQKTGDSGLNPTASPVGTASSGSFGGDNGPATHVPKPFNSSNGGSFTYSKVHRIVSKGIPYTLLDALVSPPLTAEDTLMVTPLTPIHWEYPFFYLSPREFNSLPPGSYAKSCKFSVIVRDPQIAFQTGGSDSEEATLNHNKHFIVAKGLSDSTVGTNRRITFTPNDPMKPMSSAVVDHSDLIISMYGVDQESASWNESIPASLFGIDMVANNYYCLWNYNKTYVLNNPAAQKCGWPSFIDHLDEMNMNKFVGTEILSASYNFGHAPLTAQLPSIINDRNSTHITNIGSQFPVLNVLTVTNLPVLTGLNTRDEVSIVSCDKDKYKVGSYNSTMEKSTLNRKLRSGGHDGPDHQPSHHIAMKAIPKIGTATDNLQASQFTQVHAFFEISCSIEIGYSMPNYYPHGTGHNVQPGSIMLGSGATYNDTFPNRFGEVPITYK